MKNSALLIGAGVLSLVAGRAAAAVALYDGTQPGLPQSQGWLAYKLILGTATTTLTAGAGPTILDTTAAGLNGEYAGFSNFAPTGSLVNPAFPTLSPTTGFDLTFNVKLDSESHGSNNRAGFSVLLLGNDLNGIELGFWPGQVWAQSDSPIFTHGEQTTGFDPSTGFHQYDLNVSGTTYTLTADGTQILTGATRNYTANSLAFPLNVPYSTPNFVFLGDDTTSARGAAEIQSIGVSVPEPTTGVLTVAALGLASRRRRRI